MKVELLLAAAMFGLLLGSASKCAVGDRAPSPSPGVPHASARADSETAPARPLETGVSEPQSTGRADSDLEHPVWSAVVEGGGAASERHTPASTVTTQAHTHVPGVAEQADAPAAGRDGGDLNAGSRPATGGTTVVTPVTTARPVVTQAVESSNSPAFSPASPDSYTGSAPSTGASATSYLLIAASPWPVHLHATVACLVQRESSWNAGAVGAAGEIGWMQIGPANFAYLAGYGITPSMLTDPATNLRAGWIIYLYWQRATGDGFAAWTTRGGCSG